MDKQIVKWALMVLSQFDRESNAPHRVKAINVAMEALKKQIPKKPIGEYTNYKCSICGRRVRSGKGSSSFSRDNFCQRCGQVLDWSEE